MAVRRRVASARCVCSSDGAVAWQSVHTDAGKCCETLPNVDRQRQHDPKRCLLSFLERDLNPCPQLWRGCRGGHAAPALKSPGVDQTDPSRTPTAPPLSKVAKQCRSAQRTALLDRRHRCHVSKKTEPRRHSAAPPPGRVSATRRALLSTLAAPPARQNCVCATGSPGRATPPAAPALVPCAARRRHAVLQQLRVRRGRRGQRGRWLHVRPPRARRATAAVASNPLRRHACPAHAPPPRRCCTLCGKVLDDTLFSTDATFSKGPGGASQARPLRRSIRAPPPLTPSAHARLTVTLCPRAA